MKISKVFGDSTGMRYAREVYERPPDCGGEQDRVLRYAGASEGRPVCWKFERPLVGGFS